MNGRPIASTSLSARARPSLDVGGRGEHHREFGAGEARDPRRRPAASISRSIRRAISCSTCVAGLAAERGVDRVEAADREQQQHDRRFAIFEMRLDPGAAGMRVEQAGHRVARIQRRAGRRRDRAAPDMLVAFGLAVVGAAAVSARDALGVAVREPHRLEQLVLAERRDQEMGRARRVEGFERAAVGLGEQDEHRGGIGFGEVAQGRCSLQPLRQRAARVDHGDRRARRDEARVGIGGAPRRDRAPAEALRPPG